VRTPQVPQIAGRVDLAGLLVLIDPGTVVGGTAERDGKCDDHGSLERSSPYGFSQSIVAANAA
jgi:hypothetical protein